MTSLQKVNEMAIWKNGKLTKWKFDVMESWQNGDLAESAEKMNGMLTKWQVDEMMKWKKSQLGKMAKWQADIITNWKTSWQNGKLMKCQDKKSQID